MVAEVPSPARKYASRPSSPSYIPKLPRCHSASRRRKKESKLYICNINDTDEKSNAVYVLLPTQACY
jgi:hypothetical protein